MYQVYLNMYFYIYTLLLLLLLYVYIYIYYIYTLYIIYLSFFSYTLFVLIVIPFVAKFSIKTLPSSSTDIKAWSLLTFSREIKTSLPSLLLLSYIIYIYSKKKDGVAREKK